MATDDLLPLETTGRLKTKSIDLFRFLEDGVAVELPKKPGRYLWYVSDWGYFLVGSVQVLQDTEEHKAWLRADRPEVFIYKTDDGTELTMYHEASRDHKPPCSPEGKPYVDGYVPFTIDTVNERCPEWPKWADRYEETLDRS